MTDVEQAYIEYCRTHGGSLTGIAGFRAGYEIGKALRAAPASPAIGPSHRLETDKSLLLQEAAGALREAERWLDWCVSEHYAARRRMPSLLRPSAP